MRGADPTGTPLDPALEMSFVSTEIKSLHRSGNRPIDAMLFLNHISVVKCVKDHTSSISVASSFLYHIFTLTYPCYFPDTDTVVMGLCALSPRLDKPTRIVDLEEILFSVVKNNHLTLAQRQCVGRSIYLEVCNPGSELEFITEICNTEDINFCMSVCLYVRLHSNWPLQVA